MKQSQIIADFERGKIDYKTMARKLKKLAVYRGRDTRKRRSESKWR